MVSSNVIKMVQNILEESEQLLQSQEAPAAKWKGTHLCGYPWSKTAGSANSVKKTYLLKSAVEWESVDFNEFFSVVVWGGKREASNGFFAFG